MSGQVKRTERGWGGHFICANRCRFRRNTLLECGDVRVVVSTVGAMELLGSIEEIGASGRMYETMAFHAIKEGPYWEANVRRQISFKSNWAIHKVEGEELDDDVDNKANDGHEAVVAELTHLVATGDLP